MMTLSAWLILPLGPFVGSWLGVVIRRHAVPRSWLRGRSACEACAAPLGPGELVPLLSFLALRGRCRHCAAPIGWFAPVIEIAALAVGAAALLADGATPLAWANAALGWALLTAAWIDVDFLVLPDLITLPLILAGFAVTVWFDPSALTDHAAASALGYLGFRLLNLAYKTARGRDGLGAGDAKLLAAAGAWLGTAALPWVILLAGLLGIAAVFMARLAGRASAPGDQIPFGPPLALVFFALRLAGW